MVMVLMMLSDTDVVMMTVVAAKMINADHFFLILSVGQTGLHVGVLEQLLPVAGWFGQRTNPGVKPAVLSIV